nr:hypothetical protein [Tanacetum cinerariifolium]
MKANKVANINATHILIHLMLPIALPCSPIKKRIRDRKVRIKGGNEKEIKKGMRNTNSCSLCGGTDHNKRTCTGMFKDQDEVVVSHDDHAYGDENSDDAISNDEGDKNQNSNIFGDDDDAEDGREHQVNEDPIEEGE